MSSRVEVLEMGPAYGRVTADHGAKLVLLPSDLSPEIRQRYIEYCSLPSVAHVALELARFLFDNSPYVEQIGLVGSLARGGDLVLPDIDIAYFYGKRWTHRFGVIPLGAPEDEIPMGGSIYDSMGVSEAAVAQVLSIGMPAGPSGITLSPVRWDPFFIPVEPDEGFVQTFNQFYPGRGKGLTGLASFGRDLLLLDPGTEPAHFFRPPTHWLIDQYQTELAHLSSVY